MKRASGILLHITSLPSKYGIGDLGGEAYRFIDFLVETKQSYWQLLPLNPTDGAYGNSPYSSISAFAANTLLISPDLLLDDGLITTDDLKDIAWFSPDKTDFEPVRLFKDSLFAWAYETFKKGKKQQAEFQKFCRAESAWLDDFALFVILKQKFQGQMWSDWPKDLKDRKAEALAQISQEALDQFTKVKWLQFIFFRQWMRLKDYAKANKLQLIGDIPIYVNYDSVDVWSHPELFKLDENKKPIVVAGVPPDYFSVTGQRWGNPIYQWDRLKAIGYDWWFDRIRHNLRLFDILRIDHFRGLVAFWEIPAAEKTAVVGQWVKVPYEDFLTRLLKKFPNVPIIAEDLGLITPDVTDAMTRFDFPGMKVLQFAFGGNPKENPYMPENFNRNSVVYTGTHDNNTTIGWYKTDRNEEEQKHFKLYMGDHVGEKEVAWALIKWAMDSISDTALIPMQDVLELGTEARMNTPGTEKNNWLWRMKSNAVSQEQKQKLIRLTECSKRS